MKKTMSSEQYERFLDLFEEQSEHMDHLLNSKETFNLEDIVKIKVGIRRSMVLREILLTIPLEFMSHNEKRKGLDILNNCFAETMECIASKYPISNEYAESMYENLEEFLD